ncbi:MAG: hypothetical protein ACRDU8_09785 [Egibacteraceae bacterium]
MLGSLDATGDTVVADFEAGIGTLTRLDAATVDAVLIVAEPTPKSIEVAARAAELARDKSLGRVIVVANRLRDTADHERVREAFAGVEVVAVPEDPQVIEADRAGQAPLDRAPHSPAVRALVAIAERLLTGRDA